MASTYVTVWATSAAIAQHIKHPSGAGLSVSKGTKWPDDQFTKRRQQEGAVTLDNPVAVKAVGSGKRGGGARRK